MFPGVVAANTVVVTGVLSLVLMLDIWGGVEKPGGGVISLPLVMPEKPYHEGFRAFAWRIPILVTISKTVLRHSKLFEGFKVQLGEDPVRARKGGLQAGEEVVSLVTPPMLQLIPAVLAKPSSLPLNQNPSNFIFLKPWSYNLVVTMKTLKGRKQLGEYQTGWKIKKGNVLDSCNDMSTQQCTNSGSGLSKVFWADDTTMSTYLVNRSPSSLAN
ncbi:hypothetical protein Tco_0085353 [Tanacetum coccineum]